MNALADSWFLTKNPIAHFFGLSSFIWNYLFLVCQYFHVPLWCAACLLAHIVYSFEQKIKKTTICEIVWTFFNEPWRVHRKCLRLFMSSLNIKLRWGWLEIVWSHFYETNSIIFIKYSSGRTISEFKSVLAFPYY